MLSKKKKSIIICTILGLILIAVLIFVLLSTSNLSGFFIHSDNMVVQVFEDTDQGMVEKQRVDLMPSSQDYQNIQAQVEAHTFFISNRPVEYPESTDFRTWIYMTINSTNMTSTQLLIVANDGTILFTDAQGVDKSASVLSGTSGTELYKALLKIVQ